MKIIKLKLEWHSENLTMLSKFWANDLGNLKANLTHQNEDFAKIICNEIIKNQ